MDFYAATAHSQIPAARLRVPLLHLSMDSGYKCIWYKQNQVWQQTRNIQNNSTVALIKLLPLIADLPAPADLASLDYHSMVTFMQARLLPTTSACFQYCLLALGQSPTLYIPPSAITSSPAPSFTSLRYYYQEAHNEFPSYEDRAVYLNLMRKSGSVINYLRSTDLLMFWRLLCCLVFKY